MGTVTTEASIAAASALNVSGYSKLLQRYTPKVIKTAKENERALKAIAELMTKGDDGRTPEEDAALDLLATLVDEFERRTYDIPAADPVGILQFLMEQHQLRPIDLAGTLGSRARVSEILSGKRAISKEQARKLSERFHVSPALFI